MPFKDTNVVYGLPKNSRFQVGRSDVDADQTAEQGIQLPWSKSPSASYFYYECTVGALLDSGIVVHNRLPQYNGPFNDTLATIPIDDPRLDLVTTFGVNLRCRDQYQDVIQRMAHSRYWFRIWGQALRAGYQVPIPGIKTIGGAVAIPHDNNPQWAFNRIMPGGNYSGVIMWHAMWSLWYTIVVPPTSTDDKEAMLVADPSAHISGNAALPSGMQAPYSQANDNAQSSGPKTTQLRT